MKNAVIVQERYTVEEMREVTLVGNLLRLLSFEGLEISEVLLKELVEWVNVSGIDSFGILGGSEVREELLSRVRERIPKRIEEIASAIRKH